MQLTSTLVPLAALVSIGAAAALPETVAAPSEWGYWGVTNFTITTTPLVPAYTYQFSVQKNSVPEAASCGGVAGAITCSDSTYTITVSDTAGEPFTITQKLAQAGSIAVLTGSTLVDTSCIAIDGATPETTRTVCSNDYFEVQADLASTLLP
ncbi:hypothetical protein FKW77_001657 [Venturia effusa]|uniref:AA1-like domain-containing protein n=1 Tax=Venturia effusa TaxID=50376 RepID=A0A517LKV0_9PEZI|nr:hypothetical protein FKW77_001657 [Venturia effusa]